mmetsp:Transcript_36163/g.102236  ORF Transcript_36163/g.102236 Transcript_36163/m.102236 type:complete len:548 (-) Transcript_36163:184-1827(-)|eukprot:CAMPEP_0117673270 /NCGR_PEP_ID=MMETSP0804-20121206/14381_1 /TAXON_ID=1074897 /ORGANISM="Tetraselmis astigmatica, Strain CCMP880" /LENGTH=547 /DNA_ID=CAMNT_0005481993 /DNA_START=133 /DNA_END=1779 /DNA_ORIENTATION=+
MGGGFKVKIKLKSGGVSLPSDKAADKPNKGGTAATGGSKPNNHRGGRAKRPAAEAVFAGDASALPSTVKKRRKKASARSPGEDAQQQREQLSMASSMGEPGMQSLPMNPPHAQLPKSAHPKPKKHKKQKIVLSISEAPGAGGPAGSDTPKLLDVPAVTKKHRLKLVSEALSPTVSRPMPIAPPEKHLSMANISDQTEDSVATLSGISPSKGESEPGAEGLSAHDAMPRNHPAGEPATSFVDTELQASSLLYNSASTSDLVHKASQPAQGQPSPAQQQHPVGPRPPAPPKKELEKIVEKIQRKDEYEVFLHPVTEDVAPGYFEIVKRPMDFTTMRTKVAAGQYACWEELEDDLVLMFDNAMLYNGPGTIFHKLAASMKDLSRKLVELGKQGVHSFRGRTAAIMRAHNIAQRNSVANVREHRDDPGDAMDHGGDHGVAIDFGRAQGNRSREKDLPPVRPGGEDFRSTYKAKKVPVESSAPLLGSLSDGASCEGVAYTAGRVTLRPVQPLSEEAYLRSMCRFAAGLKGAARDLVFSKVQRVVVGTPVPRV